MSVEESDLAVVETEGLTGTNLTDRETSGSSQATLAPKGTSLVYLKENDVPGASSNGRDPSQLHFIKMAKLQRSYGIWKKEGSCKKVSILQQCPNSYAYLTFLLTF